MSAISFRARNRRSAPHSERIERWATAAGRGPGPYHLIDVLLGIFIVAMLTLMEVWRGQEVAPYMVMFVAMTLVYGFRVWPLRATLIVAVAMTIVPGWIMYRHHLHGYIHDAELAEVPLMPLMFLVMAWHARRRVAAVREIEKMADQRRAVVDREREFFRDASHAIRTPVTIARGHLELLEDVLLDPMNEEDLAIALRQLDRMSALSNRLLALARLDSGEPVRGVPVDLAALVDEVGRNWASSADRDWAIDCDPTGLVSADPEWLELALDALIENAVHFTDSGEQIQLSCWSLEDRFVIAVADSGAGIAAEDLSYVFQRFWHRRPVTGPMGSGLGLPMAQAAANAHDGHITAGRSTIGGALFELILPRKPAATSAPVSLPAHSRRDADSRVTSPS
jgi:signal transduction histidine kinase